MKDAYSHLSMRWKLYSKTKYKTLTPAKVWFLPVDHNNSLIKNKTESAMQTYSENIGAMIDLLLFKHIYKLTIFGLLTGPHLVGNTVRQQHFWPAPCMTCNANIFSTLKQYIHRYLIPTLKIFQKSTRILAHNSMQNCRICEKLSSNSPYFSTLIKAFLPRY